MVDVSFKRGVSELPQKRKDTAMNYMGIDLHKKIIVICVMNAKREVLTRKNFSNLDEEKMKDFFASRKPFKAALEATAAYEWFYKLIEPYAQRVVLVHPKKMRIIAESRSKSDKVDAQLLAEYLALDHLPEAYRPSPYIQGYRSLVRFRHRVQGRITSVKNLLHNRLARYNRDRDSQALFSRAGREFIRSLTLEEADRFIVDELLEELDALKKKLERVKKRLAEYVKKAPEPVRERRAILKSMANVGDATADVVLSELGDVDRFSSQKQIAAYAGLDPGRRQSANRRVDLSITKQGSKLLRWALVETAWRMVNRCPRWREEYERLRKKTGMKKKAIVAIARRLLGVMTAMMKNKQKYREAV